MFENLKGAVVQDRAYSQALANRFDSGSETAKAVYRKYIQPNGGDVANGSLRTGAYHMGGSVYMNYETDAKDTQRGAGTTFYHEHGHLVDYKNKYISSSRTSFLESLKKDYKTKLKSTGKKYADDQKTAISRELYSLPDTANGISDIFGGLSKGKAEGMWGHSVSYWKTSPTAVAKEAFAHMFVASFDPEREKLMEQYFPTAWEEFKKILEEIK